MCVCVCVCILKLSLNNMYIVCLLRFWISLTKMHTNVFFFLWSTEKTRERESGLLVFERETPSDQKNEKKVGTTREREERRKSLLKKIFCALFKKGQNQKNFSSLSHTERYHLPQLSITKMAFALQINAAFKKSAPAKKTPVKKVRREGCF